MRRTAVTVSAILLLGLLVSGCSKCGGFERVYLPYETGTCNEQPPTR